MAKSAKKSVTKARTSKPAAKSAPAGADKQFDNTNRGVLFPNDKQGNDARPDYTGKINVDGVEKRLAAWLATGTTGEYLRITVSDFQKAE